MNMRQKKSIPLIVVRSSTVSFVLLNGCAQANPVTSANSAKPTQTPQNLNIVINGDFEQVTKQSEASNWKMAGPNTVIKSEGGNHYLVASPVSSNYVTWPTQTIDVDPSWRKVRVSTRLKATGLTGDKGAQVVALVTDSGGKSLGYLRTPSATKDTKGWVELTEDAELPEGAAQIMLMPANMGAGHVAYDDLKIVVTGIEQGAKVVGRNWYVAQEATNGDGSQVNPFNSIQAAANVAQAGDTVLIKGGTYRESIRPANSGKAVGGGSYITFKPLGKENVTISGADVVSGAWPLKASSKNVYQRKITSNFKSQLNQAEQLFVNGRMMQLARYPNLPFNSLDPMRSVMMNHEKLELMGQSPAFEKDSGWVRLTLTDSKMTLLDGTADGANLYIQPREGDADQGGGQGFTQSAKVVSQTRGKIVLDFPASYDVANWKITHQLGGGEPYYIEGTPKLLDAPGEWVREGDTLSLIPADGLAPTGKTIEIKRRDYAFDLTDRSYIRIEGLNVFAATITTDTDSGGKGAPGPRTTYRGRKDVAPAHHIVLDGLRFKYINHYTDQTAWAQGQWVQTSGVVLSGRNHLMQNCVVEYGAGNGILVIGENNRVLNNIVGNTNYTGAIAAGICMGMEARNRDCEIAYNTVYGTGFDGIMTQGLGSTRRDQPARVHHNRVSGFGLLGRDVGGIKVVGSHPEINSTRWDHNYVSDGEAWSMALYQDFSRDYVIDHNVTWEVEDGMNLNDGHNFDVRHNTLLAYRSGVNWIETLHDSKIINNVLSDEIGKNHKVKDSEIRDNQPFADATMVIDAVKGDFRLTPQFAKAGLGAIEPGETLWKVGSSLPLPIAPPSTLAVARNAKRQPTLSWKDNATNERCYYIERSLRRTRLAYWRVFEVVAELPAESISWTDTSSEALVNAPVYRVRADDSIVSNTVQVSAPGLVLRLPLSNDFKSATGNLTAVPIADRAPIVGTEGGAIFEAGKKQGLQLASSGAITPGDAITVMMWLKPAYLPGGNRTVLVKGQRDAPDYAFTTRGDENISFQLGSLQATSKSPLPANQWIHVAATYNGRTSRLYINGELEAEKQRDWWEAYKAVPTSDTPLYIGSHGPDTESNSSYVGVMRDVRLYNNQALTAQEVKAAMK